MIWEENTILLIHVEIFWSKFEFCKNHGTFQKRDYKDLKGNIFSLDKLNFYQPGTC